MDVDDTVIDAGTPLSDDASAVPSDAELAEFDDDPPAAADTLPFPDLTPLTVEEALRLSATLPAGRSRSIVLGRGLTLGPIHSSLIPRVLMAGLTDLHSQAARLMTGPLGATSSRSTALRESLSRYSWPPDPSRPTTLLAPTPSSSPLPSAPALSGVPSQTLPLIPALMMSAAERGRGLKAAKTSAFS